MPGIRLKHLRRDKEESMVAMSPIPNTMYNLQVRLTMNEARHKLLIYLLSDGLFAVYVLVFDCTFLRCEH